MSNQQYPDNSGDPYSPPGNPNSHYGNPVQHPYDQQGYPQQFPPMPPQHVKHIHPGTDIFANGSGRWMLWTALLFSLPFVLSVYPGVAGLMALVALIPPVVTAIIGGIKSWSLKVPGSRPIYFLGFLLSLPVTGGIFWQYFSVLKTGDAGNTTYPAWFSLLAMLTISIVALAQAAKLNPAIVAIRERFLANAVLVFFLGTTIGALFLPLVIVMAAALFFAGWLAYWLFMALPILAAAFLSFMLIRKGSKERQENGGVRLPPANLIRLGKLFSWSGIVAALTFIIASSLIMAYIMGGNSF
jgi:hypothetical protein